MERFGFIHDKLDIKILILYILQRLPGEINFDMLTTLVMCDDGIGYFDYIECLSELSATGHISRASDSYIITEKGVANGSAIESSLPYSVRVKAERNTMAVASAMRRDGMITASHEKDSAGACFVTLSLSDGIGDIISLKLLASGDAQAEELKRGFRENAEGVYNSIIELLSH